MINMISLDHSIQEDQCNIELMLITLEEAKNPGETLTIFIKSSSITYKWENKMHLKATSNPRLTQQLREILADKKP